MPQICDMGHTALLPKEGVLRIFSPLKIQRLRPGLNPRTWAPKASTLPLDHRNRYFTFTFNNINMAVARIREAVEILVPVDVPKIDVW